jgi:hypothetical protein
MPIKVNMLRPRLTIDCQPRSPLATCFFRRQYVALPFVPEHETKV